MRYEAEENKIDNRNLIMPLADVYETDDLYTLKLEMPGIDKEQFSVTVEENELVVHAKLDGFPQSKNSLNEFNLSGYFRQFRLGNDIDRNSIEAGLENGILTVTFHKAEEVKPRRIAITSH